MTEVSAPSPSWLPQLKRRLRTSGLDVTQEFSIDAGVRALFPFPSFGRESSLGLIVGNTKAIWPHFSAWLRQAPSCPQAPLDDYVKELILSVVQVADTPPAHCYFSPVMDYDLGEQGHGPLPIQKLASLSGLAALSPMHLNVHPTYGPWLSLRGVVVFNAPPSTHLAPQQRPCHDCSAPCLAPFQALLAQSSEVGGKSSVRESWRAWLAVRQSCPVGRAFEFDPPQSEYHYARSQEILDAIRSGGDRGA